MTHGNIILLNGTSSAGKTTLAKALQKKLDEPYLHMGNDTFLGRNIPNGFLQFSDDIEQDVPDGWLAVVQNDRFVHLKIGDVAIQWLTGMYRLMVNWSEMDNHLIGDVVIHDKRLWKSAVELFSTVPAWLVNVYCPLEIAEKHEREREDTRLLGGARIFYEGVYRYDIADVMVNTAENSPEECARQIITHIKLHDSPTAFAKLKRLFTSQ